MADYDNAEVTERERNAAGNLSTLAGFNADSTRNQLSQILQNYDQADQQNRSLADVQRNQNSRKASSERFGANKKLQTTTSGLLGTIGNALNGSALYGLLDMLETRKDLDNNEVWQALTQNQNAVENAYQESLNQNALSRNEAATNAEFGLRGIEADTAAQLNNINPSLFAAPGEGDTSVGATGTAAANRTPAQVAALAGYLMPEVAQQQATQTQRPNTVGGNSYYANLLNQYNSRRQ